ncbi:MAG TPA: sodium:alanine symporter family protein [Prolixibacteraceae bacterium]|nr:sodium:alanine symporter family protein [Bacteroidales bacterium]HQN93806.1 sodium:alanine symporter family protein [Prolixibacteraceae bacterium]
MNHFSELLQLIDSYLGGSQWFVFLLLGTGLFFTLYLKFPQIRYFKYAVKIVKGKFDRQSDKGDTSHFQALTTALSGTVGTGNIAGVALAIHLGGPAALFWMLVTAMLGMTTKFVEVTLSHKYREITADGTVAGGPMYYMKNRMKMPWLAAIFAVATIFSSFGTGSLPQINSISNSVFSTFGINKIATGAVLSILLGFVIIGGIKRIAKVTERLVPFMAIFYFLGAIAVLLFNYKNFFPALLSIFTDVFTGTAATGGFLGAGFAFAFNRGVNRGLFSNEAGQGSAPIAHAAARAHEPVSEGLVAMLEPFIDTIIICFLTGMTLLTSGVWTEKFDNQFQQADMTIIQGYYSEKNAEDLQAIKLFLDGENTLKPFSGELKVENGIITAPVTIINSRSVAEDVMVIRQQEKYSGLIPVTNGKIKADASYKIQGKSLLHSAPLTNAAFSRSWFGSWGEYVVTFGLLLFAFSTAISWSYYGDRATTYLFGNKWVIYFRIIYVIGFFLAAFTDTTVVWIFSGVTIALMTIPNLLGILSLRKEIKTDLKLFWEEWRQRFPNEKTPNS